MVKFKVIFDDPAVQKEGTNLLPPEPNEPNEPEVSEYPEVLTIRQTPLLVLLQVYTSMAVWVTTSPPLDASVNVALFPSQTLVGAVTAAEGIVEMSIGPIEGHVDPHGDSFFMKKAYTLFIEVPFIL